MIHKVVEDLLMAEKDKLFINGNSVAIVQADHPLDHALLVLSNISYTLIPVLDNEDRVVGMVSIAHIIKHFEYENNIPFSQLHNHKVKEVMEKNIVTCREDSPIEEIMNKLIDRNFLCVVDESGTFKGIVTRKEVMKRMNYLIHECHPEAFLVS